MCGSESNGSDSDHDAFQDDEGGLIVRQATIKPSLQFGNTVNRTDINCKGCDSKGYLSFSK